VLVYLSIRDTTWHFWSLAVNEDKGLTP
jgi:hypothetical protein